MPASIDLGSLARVHPGILIRDYSSVLYVDQQGKNVVFDAEGPGILLELSGHEGCTAYAGVDLRETPLKFPLAFQNGLKVVASRVNAGARALGITLSPNADAAATLVTLSRQDLPIPFEWLETDFIDVCDAKSRGEHQLRVQNESDIYETCGRAHRSHLNTMVFQISLAPNNIGVMLERAYDAFHGRQRARVIADGVFVGWWYAPVENRAERWQSDRFFVPPEVSEGKTALELAIDPPSGCPLWDVGTYTVYCATPRQI